MRRNRFFSLLFFSPCPPLPKLIPFNDLFFFHLIMIVISILLDNICVPLLLNLLALQFHKTLAQVIQHPFLLLNFLSLCKSAVSLPNLVICYLLRQVCYLYSIVPIYATITKFSLHIFHLAAFISIL